MQLSPRLMAIAEKFRRRGGLSGSAPGTEAEPMAEQVDAAADELDRQRRRARYCEHRHQAIDQRLQKRHLPLIEADDPRYHELRAAGWSPKVAAVREWFFALPDEERQELVGQAARLHVPYAQAAWDDPNGQNLSPHTFSIDEVDDEEFGPS